MISKVLAVVFAVAVLSVGGYTYWQFADGSSCCGTKAQSPEASTRCPAVSVSLPCCQDPSRVTYFSVSAGEVSCEDAPPATGPEVLAVMPREVK